MSIKIAIHHRPGSFSDGWIEYCKDQKINYKVVNCYDNDIIKQVDDCNVVMWHHTQGLYKDVLCAKNILFSLEHAGKTVYPNFKTGWHFEDKVAQKYLLESINAPLVDSYVFYDKHEALKWASGTTFPKVFKLKGGAGSRNVMLVYNLKECRKIINKAFGRGFSYYNVKSAVKDDIIRYRKTKELINIFKAVSRPFCTPTYLKRPGRENGYVYFQEFIPNNKYDTRVIVLGKEKIIAEKRFVRENDFRASGSGKFSYDNININAIKIALEVSKKLKLQTVAYDFVLDQKKNPLIVEISYGFGIEGISKAPGYWDSKLKWHNSEIRPKEWILADIIKK